MSVENVPLSRDVESLLRNLLDKAATLKTTDTLEPALPTAPFEDDITRLSAIFSHNEDTLRESSRHNIFETAARDVFYSVVAKHDAQTTTFTTIYNLLDILQQCTEHSLCDSALTLWLVEELLDSQTIDGCRLVFDYLESRRHDFEKNKLIVLRSCNELLRRLSRAEDAVFCGRVFLFLFQSFPLGDKSAVNLRGEFHTENVTKFDESIGGAATLAEGQQPDAMEVDVQQEPKAIPTGPAADDKTKKITTTTKTNKAMEEKKEEPEMDIDTFYAAFWSLQRIFSDPREAFKDTTFSAVKIGLSATLRKFKEAPKILQTRNRPHTAPTSQQQQPQAPLGKRKRSSRTDDKSGRATAFNPKYLTSRDLFTLEISDLTFQRHVLVQALIFLEFLLSLTATAKERTAAAVPKGQRALIYPYTLSDEDATWVTSMRTAIATYLQEGPEGKFYYRMVETVLARDKNWVRWKLEQCPAISKPTLPTTTYLEARRGAKRHCQPRRIRAQVMGAMSLDFLNDVGENESGLAKLREGEKCRIPDVQGYVKEAGNIELDMEMASVEEKKELVEKKASCVWRVFRVAAKTRLGVMDAVDESKGLDELDEEKMARKLEEVRAEEEAEEEAEKERVKAQDTGKEQNTEAKTDNVAADATTIVDVAMDDANVQTTDDTALDATSPPTIVNADVNEPPAADPDANNSVQAVAEMSDAGTAPAATNTQEDDGDGGVSLALADHQGEMSVAEERTDTEMAE